MITALLFVVAAASGAVARAVAGTNAWRTALLNIGGSFLLGLISMWSSPAITVVGVGALGSLTTFSSFVAHWIDKLESDSEGPLPAMIFVSVSIIGGVAAAYLGLEIASR